MDVEVPDVTKEALSLSSLVFETATATVTARTATLALADAVDTRVDLTADRFTASRSTDYRFDLPLAEDAPRTEDWKPRTDPIASITTRPASP